MATLKGKHSLLYIYYNFVWCPVGCLTSSPMSETSEMMNTTTRDNGGAWSSSVPTMQSYSIELNGIMSSEVENDFISFKRLRDFKRNRELIDWQIRLNGNYLIDSGQAYISAISKNDEVEGEISFSATLVGYGKPYDNFDPGDPETAMGGFIDITNDY